MTSDSLQGPHSQGPHPHDQSLTGGVAGPQGFNTGPPVDQRDHVGSEQLLSPDSGLCGGPGQISCEDANEMIQMVIDRLGGFDAERMLTEHFGDCGPCESEFFVYQRIVASLTRSRPRLPDDAASRLKDYCADLCEGLDESTDGRRGQGSHLED